MLLLVKRGHRIPLVAYQGRSDDGRTLRSGIRRRLDLFIQKAETGLVPVSVKHTKAARQAWTMLTKGNHHKGSNLGDCFTHASAETTGGPFLNKGEGLALRDVRLHRSFNCQHAKK